MYLFSLMIQFTLVLDTCAHRHICCSAAPDTFIVWIHGIWKEQEKT